MSKIESYLIKHGFIYESNAIYGGIQNLWDYGHLGALIKDNIRSLWKSFFVTQKKDVFFLDGSIFTNYKVWEASGHLKNFNDILVDCKDCKKRFRQNHGDKNCCFFCQSNNLTDPKKFNLMFKTDEYYLRPETAQSIFINFKNILNTVGARLPFSIAQIGKSFRNEITIQNSIFRTREFEQMEFEHFVIPKSSDQEFDWLVKESERFLVEYIGLKKDLIKFVDVVENELPHYSKKNIDIFYKFEHGWSELCGIAHRGDFDLSAHQQHSGDAMHVFDHKTNEKIIPNIIEHSIGLNRLLLATITDAYTSENERTVLKIQHILAPYQLAVFPLTKKHIEVSKKLAELIRSKNISVFYEEKNSIGKRYRKQDEIGTPYCITVDDETLSKDFDECTFTIRDRDTMSQKRIDIKTLFLVTL